MKKQKNGSKYQQKQQKKRASQKFRDELFDIFRGSRRSDEDANITAQSIRILSNVKGCTVNTTNRTIVIDRATHASGQIMLGNGCWGRIDGLVRYAGYAVVWDG